MPRKAKKAKATTANLGFEAKLWAAAAALRNNMDAAEYKHVVLGLIFLKNISDAFEAKHAELEAQKKQGADPEDRDDYRAASIFWAPKEAARKRGHSFGGIEPRLVISESDLVAGNVAIVKPTELVRHHGNESREVWPFD